MQVPQGSRPWTAIIEDSSDRRSRELSTEALHCCRQWPPDVIVLRFPWHCEDFDQKSLHDRVHADACRDLRSPRLG
jgi:hypothetical protein